MVSTFRNDEDVPEKPDATVELKETGLESTGLTRTLCYELADEAYRALPRLLKRDYGVEVTGRLVRRHLPLRDGRSAQFNIIGEARRDGRRIHVIGESTIRLRQRDVQRFQDTKLALAQTELGEVFPVLVTHMIGEPGLDDFIKRQGIALYYSFDFT